MKRRRGGGGEKKEGIQAAKAQNGRLAVYTTCPAEFVWGANTQHTPYSGVSTTPSVKYKSLASSICSCGPWFCFGMAVVCLATLISLHAGQRSWDSTAFDSACVACPLHSKHNPRSQPTHLPHLHTHTCTVSGRQQRSLRPATTASKLKKIDVRSCLGRKEGRRKQGACCLFVHRGFWLLACLIN